MVIFVVLGSTDFDSSFDRFVSRPSTSKSVSSEDPTPKAQKALSESKLSMKTYYILQFILCKFMNFVCINLVLLLSTEGRCAATVVIEWHKEGRKTLKEVPVFENDTVYDFQLKVYKNRFVVRLIL